MLPAPHSQMGAILLSPCSRAERLRGDDAHGTATAKRTSWALEEALKGVGGHFGGRVQLRSRPTRSLEQRSICISSPPHFPGSLEYCLLYFVFRYVCGTCTNTYTSVR